MMYLVFFFILTYIGLQMVQTFKIIEQPLNILHSSTYDTQQHLKQKLSKTPLFLLNGL